MSNNLEFSKKGVIFVSLKVNNMSAEEVRKHLMEIVTDAVNGVCVLDGEVKELPDGDADSELTDYITDILNHYLGVE